MIGENTKVSDKLDVRGITAPQLMNMIDEGVVYANRCCQHMIFARQTTLMFLQMLYVV